MTQRILVTAGASGIGREIVRAFCAGGASVFVCDIDSKALQATSAELAGVKTGLCDISKRHDIERMMMECVRAMGRPLAARFRAEAKNTARCSEVDIRADVADRQRHAASVLRNAFCANVSELHRRSATNGVITPSITFVNGSLYRRVPFRGIPNKTIRCTSGQWAAEKACQREGRLACSQTTPPAKD